MAESFFPEFTCTTPRILFIDMNSFFASVEQQENPTLRNRPLIVAPLMSDTTCAISASYEARRLGIKTGTSVRDAKRICPNIAIVGANHHNYVAYHDKIVEVLNHYFVDINVLSVDEMACTLSPLQLKKNNLREIALKIKTHIKRDLGVCMNSSIGIAPNVFLAKVASDVEKPDGLTIFEGDYTPLLFGMGLKDLPGIANNMEFRLKLHNIYTVEELWNASPQKLRAAWHGILGLHWYFMLRGSLESDYGVSGDEERKSVSQSHVLPPQFRTVQGAKDILLRLASKALKRLRSYKQGARTLTVYLSLRDRKNFHNKQYWCAGTTQTSFIDDDFWWLSFIEKEMQNLTIPKDFYPFKASIYFSDLIILKDRQLDLFADRDKYSRLFQVVDFLNAHHGYRVDVAQVYHLKKEAPFRISFGGSMGKKDPNS